MVMNGTLGAGPRSRSNSVDRPVGGVMGERSIGDAARELGVSIDTLRFYERRELLLAPVKRDAAQRRWYDDDDVEWLQPCLYLRGTGMPLADVRRYAELVRAGDGTEQQRLALLRAHLERVNRQLAEVQGCADAVARKVRYYEAVVDGSSGTARWGNPLPFRARLRQRAPLG